MRNRLLAAAAVAIAAPLVTLAQTTAQAPKIAPAPKASAKPYVVPRTPDGHPDLQGYWTNETVTPMERPKGLGAKEFYTDAELAENKRREEARDSKALEGRGTEPGTADDVHYDFAQFGLDRGQSKIAWDNRTSLIVGPEGTIPPMLPEARKRAADIAAKNKGHEMDGPENRPLSARCLLLGYESVPMLPAGYNNNLQIMQSAGYVTILHEMNHSYRVIPTDNSPHLPAGVLLWKGDSKGRWEGDTLVVDVTNFDPRNPFHGSGDKLHVVERFTRVADGTILYRFTVEDPTTWDKPWTAEIAMTKNVGPLYEFGCHEGNYGLANTLNGARVAEQEAAAKKSAR
jgi:hypothetical protein